jgi:hypothetical protein
MGLSFRMHRLRALALPALAAMSAIALLSSAGVTPAAAQSPSCQADFQKVMGPRMALIQRVNGFQRRRPTPQQACSTFSSLQAADRRVLAWMTENKDWCQIPDQLVEQLQSASGQIARVRGQACNAAAQSARLQAQARRQAAQQAGPAGPPPVGSGVRLPQGAL